MLISRLQRGFLWQLTGASVKRESNIEVSIRFLLKKIKNTTEDGQERLWEVVGREDTRRTESPRSTKQSSSKVTETEATSTVPTRVSTAYILCCCLGVSAGLLTVGVDIVSDFFACSLNFFPTIGLSCPVSSRGILPCLVVA